MLCADFDLDFRERGPVVESLRPRERQKIKGQRFPRISYDFFVAELWSHFPQDHINHFRELRSS